jgi:hypothetical protein
MEFSAPSNDVYAKYFLNHFGGEWAADNDARGKGAGLNDGFQRKRLSLPHE